MLQRALPKLGPPRRPRRLAEQQRSRQRAVPTARQKMQLQGVVQRKALTLEKWQAAVQRQVGREQQHDGVTELTLVPCLAGRLCACRQTCRLGTSLQ